MFRDYSIRSSRGGISDRRAHACRDAVSHIFAMVPLVRLPNHARDNTLTSATSTTNASTTDDASRSIYPTIETPVDREIAPPLRRLGVGARAPRGRGVRTADNALWRRAMEGGAECGERDGCVLVRVHVPELNVQKSLQFPRDQLVWDVKQQCLAVLPKKTDLHTGFCPGGPHTIIS
ncbi:hypothetical protein EVAR_33026_1 [Eumeta japonica]|uniref:Uncharacterized protein n=1 Tax=Eumeta variegata TaxID=151549 RepID=A0A4C1VQ89_EUMVA|nr:hypothetical protein EVAR_33026_1 [Eumeta japonica]